MDQLPSFLSGGLVGGLVGAFLGGFTKFFWERWLPDWMTWRRDQKIAREKILSQFRAPAIRAMSELQDRIFVILHRRAANYEYLKAVGQHEYYIESTTFLVAQCYAWMEILRERMATFDYAELFMRVEEVTRSFSGGRPGFQVFRLEQREIGERMLCGTDAGEMHCLGYSEFLDALKAKGVPSSFSLLRERIESMLEHWPNEVVRLTRIQHALIDTINFIDPEGRWVPKDRRALVDAVTILEQLVASRKISKTKARPLLKEASEISTRIIGREG